jgi:uncharacterized membrane protein SirB2
MEALLAIKWTHVTLAVLSGLGFAVNGALRLSESPWRARRWVRTTPHVIDTLLLASAVLLAWRTGQMPWRIDWLGVKMGVLAAYIACGFVALRGPWAGMRLVFYLIALALYAQIVAIALSRDGAGLLRLLS